MNNFKTRSQIIKSTLVISLALFLPACTNPAKKAPACIPDTPDKISSAPDPLTIPYQSSGCSEPKETMAEIKDKIRTANGTVKHEAAIGALRAQALRETALSLGARGGLAEKALMINNTLLNYEPLLSKVFQFYGLLLDDNILPPVLVEARNTLNLTGTDAIRIADRNYKIISQSRFVTAPPTWREYIWMSYDPPELPDRSLLPRTKPERIIWERDIDEGWQAGLKQGDVIFTENINRLVRDIKGMVLYRQLLAQNMVSPPYTAAMDMGITGNGEDMTVNDRLLRITAFPQLQANSDAWKTEIHQYE